MGVPIDILFGLAVVLWLLYSYLIRNFHYWEKQHVEGPKPIPFFGSFKDVVLRKIRRVDYFKLIYDSYPNEHAVGLYKGSRPLLLIKDPDMIKEVLIKHFTIFPNRGIDIDENVDPLSMHIMHMDHKRWRPLRMKFLHAFTSVQLRNMFCLMNERTENFVDHLKNLANENKPVDMKELAAKFTTDVVGVCMFGLNINAMDDDKSLFRKYGRAWMSQNWYSRFRLVCRTLPSWAAKLIKPLAGTDEMENFFVNAISSTIEYRKQNNIKRNDIIDLLIDLQNNPDQVGGEELTDVQLAAQAFIFFLTGFDPTSLTISHALYELAHNPDCQDKLREEIQLTLDKHNGKINYDSIEEMTYLDKVYKETLRMYPPTSNLHREAVKDHTFINNKISVNKGVRLNIPVHAIHNDSSIYKNPEKFDPERFTEEVASLRPPMSYLPFGDGPRNCIGERYGRILVKLGLTAAVKNFQFYDEKTTNVSLNDVPVIDGLTKVTLKNVAYLPYDTSYP